jgi:hypothetical protein
MTEKGDLCRNIGNLWFQKKIQRGAPDFSPEVVIYLEIRIHGY